MTPKPMPPIKPSAMTILLFGLLLLCGGDAGWITLVSEMGKVSCCLEPM